MRIKFDITPDTNELDFRNKKDAEKAHKFGRVGIGSQRNTAKSSTKFQSDSFSRNHLYEPMLLDDA
jgi:hypothetical protein